MTVTNKDIPTNKNLLGQFLTPKNIVDFCLSKTEFHTDIIIEPSCGKGVFLDPIRQLNPDKTIIALELDPEMSKCYKGKEEIININFYDFRLTSDGPVHFIGNPPYRSPAYSLETHGPFVRELREVYGVRGVREESVLFLLQTVDALKRANVKGYIDYILPTAIFKNNSPVFSAVAEFFRKHLNLKSIWNLSEFPGVSRNLVYASFETGVQGETVLIDGVPTSIGEFYGVGDEIIPFQRMFKKTYLGSVPCESIFLSCRGEDINDFRSRLIALFSFPIINETDLLTYLSYNGMPHLRALRNANGPKIKTIHKYWNEAKKIVFPNWGVGMPPITQMKYYAPIRHRDEDRWYFRYDPLKKCKFVYQLNPKPCHSFYFPGNPSNKSKDYFGYCRYDINRNSGPGANRTVPVDDVESNLTNEFKTYWDKTGRPYDHIFEYMRYIGEQSEWYKEMKKKYERFYFGIPKEFDKGFDKYRNEPVPLVM